MQRELAAAATILAVILIWAMFTPAPLLDLANPGISPNPAKAAWFFVGLQELLLHMHPSAAIGLVGVILAFVFLIPVIDRSGSDIGIYFRSKKGKWLAAFAAFLSIDLVIALVLLDEYRFDLTAALPGLPAAISYGLIPVVVALVGMKSALR